MHVSRIATVILIALLVGVPALNVFRTDELGSPPPTFESGLWWGPQISLITPTSARIDFATIQTLASELRISNDQGNMRSLKGPEGQVHHFELRQLQPGSAYTYRVQLGPWLGQREYAFRTPPASPDVPFHFVALGDTGSGSPRQLALIDRIAKLQPQPEVVVITGDIAYPNGTPAEVRARFTIPWSRIHGSTPILFTLGNHDVKSEYGTPALDAITLPTNTVDGSEAFYESVHRSVRFVCINSEVDLSPDSKQYAWLDHTLSKPTAGWTVVFGHRAIYPGSRSGGDAPLRNDLVPLMEKHGVDLYLSGHDHVYMRTFPMRSNKPVVQEQDPNYRNPGAPMHVVTGGGGKSLYRIIPQPHLAQAFAKDHIVVFEATPRRIEGRVLNSAGDVLDRFSIEK